jgi:UDP-2,3-diacylglucosamine hydrolase
VTLYFVSDVHLSRHRPERLEAFLSFLAREARRADAVYILGDLFDLWLGDDDRTPPHPRVVDALAELGASGTTLYAMHGNHDFLMGAKFEQRTGCRLLPDPSVVEVQGKPVLLSHGDSLCTDDAEYQQWRAFIHNTDNQRVFLGLPLFVRKSQAAKIRKQADERAQLKPHDIMDVNQRAVEDAMRAAGVRLMVHGHTHRPAVHHFDLDGEPATRIVLGDWYEGDTLLRWDAGGYHLGPRVELNAIPAQPENVSK